MRSMIAMAAILVLAATAHAQVVDINRAPGGVAARMSQSSRNSFSLFRQGLLDMFLGQQIGGSAQATTEVIRIMIGEPNGFRVPFYWLVGIGGKALNGRDTNLADYAGLITPTGGLLNLTFSDNEAWELRSFGQQTKLYLAYQIGGKGSNATDTANQAGVFAFSFYGDVGLFFHTPAIYDDSARAVVPKQGQFWLQAKAFFAAFDSASITSIFGVNRPKLSSAGITLSAGLFINDVINAKVTWTKPLSQDRDEFNSAVVRLALDYQLSQ